MKKHQLTDLLGGTVEIETEGVITRRMISGIEIPIIQRDYAQGRPEVRTILDRFLKAIFKALELDHELELDFVYGSVRQNGGKSEAIFLPLDGQQRLTTLYLLHWYIANAELPAIEQQAFRERLAGFRYATRGTATQFCEKLAGISETKNTADQIRQAYWFHKNYEKDPTVMAMLNTIHEIEQRYKQLSMPVFDRLSRLRFYLLPLEGFNLTDELYIKMNARGKQLTDFENFKADLVGGLKDDQHPEHAQLSQQVIHGHSTMPYYLTVASKIDNSWTDIFWPVAKLNEKAEDKIVDPYFLRFINRYVFSQYILYSPGTQAEIEGNNTFQSLYGPQGTDTKIPYRQFDMYAVLTQARNIARFEQLMDNLYLYQRAIRQIIKPYWDLNDDWFLFDEKINQVQRILFVAVMLYLECPNFRADRFAEWMRVCSNIMIDPDIRSIPAMITAMKTIARLAAGCGDIYAYLETDVFERQLADTNNIHRDQLIEERLKARLLGQSGWAEPIYRAEAHFLFQGNIGFLLHDNPGLELFEQRVRHAFMLFNRSGTDKSFREDFGVYRFVISKFPNWDAIEKFTYADDYRNWQLNLRRNVSCKNGIALLCSSANETEIHRLIDSALIQHSEVSGWNDELIRKVHENLYRHKAFTSWTQQEGVSRIKWLYGHFYIIRPSAWYDKVMIDGYRNELIDHFCRLAKISTDHRCGTTAFFWGEDIDLDLPWKQQRLRVQFTKEYRVLLRKPVEEEGITVWKVIFDKSVSAVQNIVAAQDMAEQLFAALEAIDEPGKTNLETPVESD